jgi:nucleotide-binding universal stress UspA family protein
MKKLSTLLAHRQALLRQARLANLAFAYHTLGAFAERIGRARLTGRVTLRHAAPDAERYWASLTALDGSQSVIEEHFSDEDLMDLADVVAFATANDALDITFRLEELGDHFLAPLRAELERAGVSIDTLNSEHDAVH